MTAKTPSPSLNQSLAALQTGPGGWPPTEQTKGGKTPLYQRLSSGDSLARVYRALILMLHFYHGDLALFSNQPNQDFPSVLASVNTCLLETASFG